MLAGIRVLDFTRVLAGPLATMLLGDLGADVLKVERRAGGDDTRGWGPPFDSRGESAYFLSVNRNKRSLAVDLDDPADRRLLLELAAGADVAVDNFLPGTLEKRGLDPQQLLERNPRLVWCTVTGFGPESARPGYDLVVQAECGWMAITGEPEGDPVKTGIALADVIAGKDAAIAILATLVKRAEAPAEHRRLHISLQRSAVAALVNVAQGALVSGGEARRWGNAHASLVPYQLFHAADRPLVVAVGNDAQWRACARAIGLEGLAADPRFATNAGRVEHRVEVVGALSARLLARPAAEWLSLLDRAGVPCGLVKSVLQALAEVPASPVWGVAPPVPGAVRLPPPRLDEHGDAVRSLGWRAFTG